MHIQAKGMTKAHSLQSHNQVSTLTILDGGRCSERMRARENHVEGLNTFSNSSRHLLPIPRRCRSLIEILYRYFAQTIPSVPLPTHLTLTQLCDFGNPAFLIPYSSDFVPINMLSLPGHNPRGVRAVNVSIAVGVIDTIAVALRLLARWKTKASIAADDWFVVASLLPLYLMITASAFSLYLCPGLKRKPILLIFGQ